VTVPDVMLLERLDEFTRRRRAWCLNLWVTLVLLPAFRVIGSRLRWWAGNRCRHPGKGSWLTAHVVSAFVRPRNLEERVSRFDPPDDADAHEALRLARGFDPDAADWTKILKGKGGRKLNALRNPKES
jgi:hypothetical protein